MEIEERRRIRPRIARPVTDPPPPEAVLLQLLNGAWVAQAIHTAAVLGIADALDAGPSTVEALAGRTGAHAPSLHRLLRALASVGLFVEDEAGRLRAHAGGCDAPRRRAGLHPRTRVLLGSALAP